MLTNDTEDTITVTPWGNTNNAEFYNAVPITKLAEYARSAGIDDCRDVRLVWKFTLNSPTSEINTETPVLEIGSGYGRAIAALAEKHKDVTGIEYNANYAKFLKERFNKRVGVTIIQGDIKKIWDYQQKKYGLILWLFSGITDFSAVEQQQILRMLTHILLPGGMLIIDTPLGENNANKKEGQTHVIEAPGCPTYKGFLPSNGEFGLIAKKNKMQVRHVPYGNGRSRCLHIFQPADVATTKVQQTITTRYERNLATTNARQAYDSNRRNR
jgi:SAM-dependent methyltransferase